MGEEVIKMADNEVVVKVKVEGLEDLEKLIELASRLQKNPVEINVSTGSPEED